MAAHTPEAVHAEWMKAFNDGNLAGMVALYEPNSAVVSEPGGAAVRDGPSSASDPRLSGCLHVTHFRYSSSSISTRTCKIGSSRPSWA
jgi:hypothetical protein